MTGAPIAVIAGASGFVGTALVAAFAEDGYEVRTIGRRSPASWSDPASIAQTIEGADVLVNLAGKSVNCRYTDANRNEILRSRVETTRALRTAVAAAEHPPRVWLNASTATIYRHSMRPAEHREPRRAGERVLGGCRHQLGAGVLRGRPAEHAARGAPHGHRAR